MSDRCQACGHELHGYEGPDSDPILCASCSAKTVERIKSTDHPDPVTSLLRARYGTEMDRAHWRGMSLAQMADHAWGEVGKLATEMGAGRARRSASETPDATPPGAPAPANCDECGGMGTYWLMPDGERVECSSCQGTGELDPVAEPARDALIATALPGKVNERPLADSGPPLDDIAEIYDDNAVPDATSDRILRLIRCIRDAAMEAECMGEMSGYRVEVLRRHGLTDSSDPAFGPVKYPDQGRGDLDPAEPF